jgi:hypothetical protein
MDGTPLVTLAHADGTSAIVRAGDGTLWLVDDGPQGVGTGVRDHRAEVGSIGPERTVAGGRVPDGAVRAVVRDRAGREHGATVGDGAWLALLDQPIRGESPVVRFLDVAGDVVAVPVPAGVETAPVGDAAVPCPACGAVDWGRVVRAPSGRYGEDGAGRPTAALCRRCGHAESLGVLFAAAPGGGEPDLAAIADARARMADVARTAPFPCFGPAGHAPTLAGYGESDDVVDSVTLASTTPAGPLEVTTSTEPLWEPAAWTARRVLEGLHERDDAWPDGSETAVSLWLAARDRAHAADAAAARDRAVSLSVDGRDTPFAVVVHGDRFAAVAQIGDLTLTVSGRGAPDGLALVPVAGTRPGGASAA